MKKIFLTLLIALCACVAGWAVPRPDSKPVVPPVEVPVSEDEYVAELIRQKIDFPPPVAEVGPRWGLRGGLRSGTLQVGSGAAGL